MRAARPGGQEDLARVAAPNPAAAARAVATVGRVATVLGTDGRQLGDEPLAFTGPLCSPGPYTFQLLIQSSVLTPTGALTVWAGNTSNLFGSRIGNG